MPLVAKSPHLFRHPHSAGNDRSPVTGYTAAEVARFHVGDTVIVSLSGLPQEIPVHQEPIKEDGTITMPISVMFKLRAKLRASFKTNI